MILSAHLADAGAGARVELVRRPPDRDRFPGLVWAQRAFTVPLGASARHPPVPDGTALLAAWADDHALDEAVASAPALTAGWHARLAPLRSVGEWSGLRGLPGPNDEVPEEPVAVVTLGRLRLLRAVPFLRASNPAEREAAADPAVVLGTALAWPPRFVATFSLWRSAGEMRRYATVAGGPHAAAMRQHARAPFHHESLFARFRPYGVAGTFRGVATPHAEAQRVLADD